MLGHDMTAGSTAGDSMSTLTEILNAHPQHSDVDMQLLTDCLETCGACVQACTACADACLGEQWSPDLVENVRAMLDCADICSATGRVLARLGGARTSVAVTMLEACVAACRACQATCGATNDVPGSGMHAAACQLTCARCAEVCERLLASLRVQ